ncbi:MAG: sensor histidine kinase [Nitrospirae bacterium]|nr:sensor histidine kinase [Nitrospirota bacterium]
MESVQEHSLSVGRLVTSREYIPPCTAVTCVAERFFNSSSMDAVALVECREPVGLATRSKLLFRLFRRFGFELYGKKPIISIADPEPLMIHEDERLDVAIDTALDRPADDVYDDIIVVNNSGNFTGLLSVKQMVIQQSNALVNSVIQKEMAREKAKDLEKINRIKSQFIANVTHELRSPLNAIIGLTELMKMSYKKGNIEQMRDRLAMLMSSSTYLRSIVTNVLDLSKLEAGKMEAVNEKFDMVPILREVAATTRVLLGNKPVSVEVIAHDGPVLMVSDPVKARQILTNIINNAAKFTERGRIVLALGSEKERLKISVSDTGIGIREDNLKKIFEAFSQIEDAGTRRYEGTGLGLTITRNLLTILGGSISVSSKLGEGTTVDIYLPFKNNGKKEL